MLLVACAVSWQKDEDNNHGGLFLADPADGLNKLGNYFAKRAYEKSEAIVVELEKLPVVQDRSEVWDRYGLLFESASKNRAYTKDGDPILFDCDTITFDEFEALAEDIYTNGGWHLQLDSGERIEVQSYYQGDWDTRIKQSLLNSMRGDQPVKAYMDKLEATYVEVFYGGNWEAFRRRLLANEKYN